MNLNCQFKFFKHGCPTVRRLSRLERESCRGALPFVTLDRNASMLIAAQLGIRAWIETNSIDDEMRLDGLRKSSQLHSGQSLGADPVFDGSCGLGIHDDFSGLRYAA